MLAPPLARILMSLFGNDMVDPKLTYSRVEVALERLANTDETFAARKADMERYKHKAKAVFSAIFLRSEGTVRERECIAEMSETYQNALSEWFTAIEAFEKMRNERDHEERVIEVWRSLNSARNKGQIV